MPAVPPVATARPGRRRILVVAVALAGGAGGGALAARLAEPRTTSVVTAGTVSTGGVVDLAAVASSVAPSVVTVEVATRGGAVTGSGVVLSDDGRILTNDHVVADATGPVTVRLADGRTARATVVGGDPETDLAVLRAEGVDGLTPAVFGDSSAVRVGGTVLALGSPLGLEGTVTAGIVSAVDRTADWLTGLIQTDAPVDAGSSGGAVVGTAGRVVGITVAIATTGADTGNIGVGFAIPSDTAGSVVTRLLAQAGQGS
ncbi:trypsin-like peptidase domain-containing protein [Polymorphospora sp. NPDC051019]|uniref:S1C family serine protease n=1 Tax=Polymorphospora sp. NPDC051019 TaxID=3155725 RepID=UPI0034404E09